MLFRSQSSHHLLVNTGGSGSFLNYYSTVNGFTGWISITNLGFIPIKPGLDLVIFILSIGGVLAAS